ncbi:CPBP family intramembrane glutamic endopeptidase [Arenimonas sp. MALMAid1274]|uniref:CPBP family intramembrane glutamic endopeptidase n=1 Tax=Arenimonas sp. MALMAid1274 TaxID=3411630 RepID=UPI003B9EBA1D
MTSDPVTAATAVEPPPLPAAVEPTPAPKKPSGPFPGFLVDSLLAGLILMVASTLLVTAVMVPSLLSTEAGSADFEGIMETLMPQITVAAIAAMLIAAVGVWAARGRSLAAMPRPGSTAIAYVFAVLAGLAVQGFAWLVSWLLAQADTGIRPSNAEPLIALARSTPWLAWLMVVVVGPFAEELLFRHVLLRRFALAGRGVAGLVLISVLFALMHEPVPGEQPLLAWLGALVLYTGMGVGFGAVYLRTGRLGAAFVAHATCNLAAMALLAYSIG